MKPSPDRAELLQRYERRVELMVPAPIEMLKGLPLFAGIPEKARDKVMEKVRAYIHLVEFVSGESILREGEYSDSAFFVLEGTVEVVLGPAYSSPALGAQVRGGAHVPLPQRPGARPNAERMIGRPVGTGASVILAAFPAALKPGERTLLGEGEIFGELSALSRYPVSATVQAVAETKLLQIRLPGLRMLMASSKEFKAFLEDQYRQRSLAVHLRSVSLFADVEDAFIDELTRRAELLSFEPGQIIVQEGAPAECFYLVRGGLVKVSVKAGASDLAVTYLRKGDYAGQTSLLLAEPWPFALQALDHVELVKLSREDFREIAARYPFVEDRLWKEMTARLAERGAVADSPTSSEYMQMAMETGLIHGESVLLIDLSTCTRCDDCVRGCADAHEGVPRFLREGQKYRNWLVPTACYQCTDPVCMIGCPTGAITRALGTLEVTINPETCIGCRNCEERCPWGNIIMVETDEKRADGKPVEVATKCDLCLTRPQGPACVQMCPHGSSVRISFKDLERVTALLK